MTDALRTDWEPFDLPTFAQGLQVGQKIKMSPWEVIEGHKNPAPISWSYFGAIRLEKKTLTHEDQHRLLMYHTHSMRQPDSHYMQPPPLPPEELQPPPEKVVSTGDFSDYLSVSL